MKGEGRQREAEAAGGSSEIQDAPSAQLSGRTRAYARPRAVDAPPPCAPRQTPAVTASEVI